MPCRSDQDACGLGAAARHSDPNGRSRKSRGPRSHGRSAGRAASSLPGTWARLGLCKYRPRHAYRREDDVYRGHPVRAGRDNHADPARTQECSSECLTHPDFRKTSRIRMLRGDVASNLPQVEPETPWEMCDSNAASYDRKTHRAAGPYPLLFSRSSGKS